MKINKKIMTLVLCSSFIMMSAQSGLVSFASELDKASEVEQVSNEETAVEGGEENVTDSDEVELAMDSNYIEEVKMPEDKPLKIKVNPKKTGDGYLVLAVSENACEFKKDKKPLELTLTNNGKEYKTIVLKDYASYKTRINKKDMYEFYIPAPKLQENMELILTDPNEGASITEKFSIAAYSHNIGKDKLVAAPKYEDITNNTIKATGSYEDEIVYEGFIFGNVNGENQESLFIRPITGNRDIKLKLGTYKDDIFSYTSSNDKNNKFRVRYYDTEKTYKDIEANGVKDSKGKNRYPKEQYRDEKVTVGESNSVNLPFLPNNGIIRIELENPNTFLLRLSVEGTSSPGNVDGGGGSGGETEKPEENNDINSYAKRFSGDNRYFTAIKLSKEAYSKSDVAVIASGENFADALSGGALAAIYDAPLLLVDESSKDSVKRELDRLDAEKIYILGGKKSISDNIEGKLAKNEDNKLREVYRLSGSDRYKTSIEVYREIVRTGKGDINPVLVNGKQFADALSAGPIAAKDKRAIVLTDGHNVDSRIDKKSDKNIIVGGYTSMDNSFAGYRYSGRDRYETSAKIAKHFNSPKNALLASGEKYPDGLAAITLYNKYEGPLLLTRKDSLPKDIKSYISSSDIENVYIIGGTSSVSEKVENTFNK